MTLLPRTSAKPPRSFCADRTKIEASAPALEAGNSIEWEPADEANLTIAEITALYTAKVDSEDEAYRELLTRSLLSPALSPGWRSTFEERLTSIS